MKATDRELLFSLALDDVRAAALCDSYHQVLECIEGKLDTAPARGGCHG